MKKLFAFLLCCSCTTVLAHPSFDHKSLPTGAAFKADLMVTHGCGNSPTIKLVVIIPEDVIAITPQVKPGWAVETTESDLSQPRMVFGMERTRFTSQIVWSGGSLSSDFFDVFSFIVIPSTEPATLYFPTTQYCEEGVDAYTEIPGTDSNEEHQNLAPSLTVFKPEHETAH